MAFTLNATVETFDRVAFRTDLAAQLGVGIDDVFIQNVTAGSISVNVVIRSPVLAPGESNPIVELLSNGTATAAIDATYGVLAVSTPVVDVVTYLSTSPSPPPHPPLPLPKMPPPSSPTEEALLVAAAAGARTWSVVIAIVFILLFSMVVAFLFRRWCGRGKRMLAHEYKVREEAAQHFEYADDPSFPVEGQMPALDLSFALPAPPLEQIDIDELSPRSGAWVSQMRYLEQAGLGSAPNSAREAVARGARQVAFEMQMEARREAATVQQAAGMPSMGLGPTRPVRYDLPSPAPLPSPMETPLRSPRLQRARIDPVAGTSTIPVTNPVLADPPGRTTASRISSFLRSPRAAKTTDRQHARV